MDDELLQRLGRIYAAIGTAEEMDPSKLKATVILTDTRIEVFQDFRGDVTDEEMTNHAHSIIHNIANLRDHLRRWADRNGREKKRVDETIEQSFELQIIRDLSNNDKHGYPPRNDGCSGKRPKLVEIRRIMQLKLKPQGRSTIGMTLAANGEPRFFGNGTAKAVITGEVVDKDGHRVGDLHKMTIKAIKAWEQLIDEFGLGSGQNCT